MRLISNDVGHIASKIEISMTANTYCHILLEPFYALQNQHLENAMPLCQESKATL